MVRDRVKLGLGLGTGTHWYSRLVHGQAWSSVSPRGQWRTGKNGENWLQNHLWFPNHPSG